MDFETSRMSEPQTIAIIAGQLVLGGAERQLYLWLSNLDRSRFRPVVVTLHPDCEDYWESAIELLDVPLLRIASRRNPLPRLLEIMRALRPYNPQLIHGWHLFASPYAGAAAILLGARASLGSLRSSFDAYRRHRMQSILTEWLTDGIVVNSASAAERLAPLRRRARRRIYTVPNAVEDEMEERPHARARLSLKYSIPPARLWIGSAGRFVASKRFDLLLEMTALLHRRSEDVHLVLVGDGPLRKGLQAKAQSLDISDRVTFTGEVAEARLWMSALDIFCFLSEDEGLPNAVMEAAAAGVPVVAWRTPFLEELLDEGRSAVLVAPGNLQALEEALVSLIHDPAARDRLGRRGRSHVLGNFGVRRFVEAMTSAYETVLAGAS
jgi:glycosyltransferase involved in cell wall biosynthesis